MTRLSEGVLEAVVDADDLIGQALALLRHAAPDLAALLEGVRSGSLWIVEQLDGSMSLVHSHEDPSHALEELRIEFRGAPRALSLNRPILDLSDVDLDNIRLADAVATAEAAAGSVTAI